MTDLRGVSVRDLTGVGLRWRPGPTRSKGLDGVRLGLVVPGFCLLSP